MVWVSIRVSKFRGFLEIVFAGFFPHKLTGMGKSESKVLDFSETCQKCRESVVEFRTRNIKEKILNSTKYEKRGLRWGGMRKKSIPIRRNTKEGIFGGAECERKVFRLDEIRKKRPSIGGFRNERSRAGFGRVRKERSP